MKKIFTLLIALTLTCMLYAQPQWVEFSRSEP